ncbi:hypothetical protein BC835DRAFT_1413551 [Cytidiella melzeri]|nr:hypothetical protein BC835DRAFT_1413551 [Cytidiella melzeri]
MRIGGNDLTFINVYNDSRTFAADTHLLERAEALPRVTALAGDFNLHDPMWDEGKRREGVAQQHLRQREEVKELAQEQLGLELLNELGGPPTWMSNNFNVCDGVIDLVWVNPEAHVSGGLQVDDIGRMQSDHAVLRWEVRASAIAISSPNVKRGSEEGKAYVCRCRTLLNAIPLKYELPQQVEAIGDMLGTHLERLWQQHASMPRAIRHSKSWWSPECSKLDKQIRDLRHHWKELVTERKHWQSHVIREREQFDLTWHQEVVCVTKEIVSVTSQIDHATGRMKGTVRRAKRTFFDGVIAKTNKSRIWDLVEWTKPRRMSSTTGLVDSEGSPIDEP